MEVSKNGIPKCTCVLCDTARLRARLDGHLEPLYGEVKWTFSPFMGFSVGICDGHADRAREIWKGDGVLKPL